MMAMLHRIAVSSRITCCLAQIFARCICARCYRGAVTFLIIPETHSIEMSWETLPVDYGIEIARNYLASEQAPRAYPTPLTPCSTVLF